jgi:hypothetical protein
VNQIKLGVFLGGVVGLVGCFLPIGGEGDASYSLWDTHTGDLAAVVMVLVGFAMPIALGALAIAKPPFMRWQALGALVALALVAIKIRAFLPFDVFTNALGWKLIGGGLYLGLLASAVGVARPEQAR